MLDTARILVVDDEQHILNLIADSLPQSFSIVIESNPLNALIRLRREHFDLLILDLNMPHLAGEEVIQQIRSDPRLSSLPILVMTADLGLKKRLEGLSVEGILTKPFTLGRLSTEVERITRRRVTF